MDDNTLTKHSIDYALWEITHKCNLSCIHCRANASPLVDENNLIRGEAIYNLIDSLSNLKTKVLVLTGGEPLLRNDLEEIISYARKKSIKCRIQSNGLLLTEERILKLKESGIFSFGIGLDSPDPEIHDYIRNKKGAFDQVIKTINLLKQFEVKCHVEFTLTKLNSNQLDKMFNLLNELKIDTFLMRAAIFEGRATTDNKNFVLSSIEYRDALKRLHELSKQYPNIIANSQDPLYHLVDNKIKESLNKVGNIQSGKIISGCTVGINMIHIRTNGDIGQCTFLPNITLGNCLQTPLEQIWKERFQSENLCNIAQRNFLGKCGNCIDKYICGGCRARAYKLNNDLLSEDPYCWKN